MNPSILRHFVWIAFQLATGAALAQPATVSDRYGPAPAIADGIGKREERTDLHLATLSLKPALCPRSSFR